ncbi:MAG TPA: transglycosylase SLT domain-containing protein [Gemmatimonadales bacterium]|nr:transglycosylase SLT domain-containing protein [Gemmatimonadales bacterium]
MLVLLAGYGMAALVYLPDRIGAGYADARAARAIDSAAVDVSGLAALTADSLLAARRDTSTVATGAAITSLGAMAAAPAVVDSAELEEAAIRRFAHGPLARVLARRAGGLESSSRIASALVREARRLDVAPSLLAAVLIVENPHLDTNTVSSQGAMGLMQVMPFHAGEHGCAKGELLDIDNNICHGARVFGQYLKRSGGDTRRALLRYNGCVRSTNTPRCHRYPDKVMRLARTVRQQLLRYAALAKQTGKAAPAAPATPPPAHPTATAAAALPQQVSAFYAGAGDSTLTPVQ